jgi:hypothetical protein
LASQKDWVIVRYGTAEQFQLFGEIPKIFDRNFLVAYFLPTFGLVAASLGFVHGLSLLAIAGDAVKLGAFGIALPLILAVLLLALNRPLFQLFEGYGRCNPFRLLGAFSRIRHETIDTAKRSAEREVKKAEGAALAQLARRYENIRSELAERFPPSRDSLLSTFFGNAISSFEEYSRAMYGFDAVEGWPRLLAVIPKDYRDLIDSSKADTDFWVNLRLASFLLSADYIFSKLYMKLDVPREILGELPPLWPHHLTIWPSGLTLLSAALILCWWSARRATRSAIEWGVMVKSSFDVFLPDLYSKMGFTPASSANDLNATWNAFSQAIVYRLPDVMPPRVGARSSNKTQPLN